MTTKWIQGQALHVFQNLETGPWTQNAKLELVDPEVGELSIGRLPRGTEEGRSTVYLRIDTKDGESIVFETTLRLLWLAAKALKISAEQAGEVVEGP